MEQLPKLQELRKSLGMTQSEVANILHTSRSAYSEYQRGIRNLPGRHIKELAPLSHVSADYILGLTDRP